MTNMKDTNRNGNSKGVRCLTDGKFYPAMKDAAKAAGVCSSSMSYAIKHKTPCKGKRYNWEREAEANTMEMGRNLSEALVTREEMAEFYQWKAEKEAEAKRQEAIRKAKENHAKAITKAREKTARLEAEVERRKARLKLAEDRLMAAQIELEALMDKEV